MQAETGLGGVDRDDGGGGVWALTHEHPAPAAAGGAGQGQGILAADIGRLAGGKLIPPEHSLIGAAEQVDIGGTGRP